MSKKISKQVLSLVVAAVMAVSIGGGTAFGQVISPSVNPALIVPPPAPLPPPNLGVPVVPKLDAAPTPQVSRQKPSFGDRITDCLQDGAAAGLNSSDRAVYSRGCANR